MSIIVNNLTHVYNKKTDIKTTALDNVSFKLDDHFFLAIVGETGSGKTTLLQHLNGLILPDSGEIIIDEDKLINKKNKNKKSLLDIRKKVGYLFQFSESQLFESSVLEDVMFAPLNFKYSKDEAKKLAFDALKLVGLKEELYDKSPFTLSGGEQKRVALAGILACKPKYLLLDEPTSGLDKKGKEDLFNLLNKLYENGTSIILVTHDMDFVLKSSKDVMLMSEGKIVTICPTNEFFKLDYLEKYNIIIPKILRFCRGFSKINLNNVKDIDSFIKEIKSHE